MADAIPIGEAKTHLSKLVERASAGEEIIIRRGQRRVAKLVAYEPPKVGRAPGRLRGQIRISEDFDADLPADVLDSFERP